MAPTKKSATTSKSARRTPSTNASKSRGKKTDAKRSGAGSSKKAAKAVKKAARAAKKAVEPVTRAAGAAKRATTHASNSKKGGGRQQPDAIQVLTDDHRKVEELFVRFEKTGDGAHKRRQDLVQRITEALSIHASIEEEIFYPAARRFVADAGDDVLEALEEHHLVKVTLAELETMDPSHERYGAKVTVLIENVRHHVEEEEGQLFPTIRDTLAKDQLREIGSELVAAKRTAPTRPYPEAPDTPPGNIVAQVLTAPLDAAANLNKAAARRVRDIVT
jgi:hemerythrin superfamily protein